MDWFLGVMDHVARKNTGVGCLSQAVLEVEGIVSKTYGPLLTDRDTRAIIGQTIQSIDLGIVQAPVNFKTGNGFVPLDRAAFVAIATEIAAHVQSTFDKEGQIDAKINDGTITTKAEIDAAFSSGTV